MGQEVIFGNDPQRHHSEKTNRNGKKADKICCNGYEYVECFVHDEEFSTGNKKRPP